MEGEWNKLVEALLRAWALGDQRRFSSWSELNLLLEVVGNRDLTWQGCAS